MSTLIVVSLLGFVSACWVFDLGSRRVPNWLSGGGTVLAFALNCSLAGVLGLVHGVFGLAVAMVVLLGPFALGGLGGGDVKMMGAIGALLGPALTLQAIALGFMVGGLITLVHVAYLGRTGEIMARMTRMIVSAIRRRSLAPLRVDAGDPGAISFPYTVPLGMGSILAVVLSTGVWS